MISRSTEKDDEPLAAINITPLVDVMLVLLAIFLVVAPLLTRAIRVDLPQAAAGAAEPREHAVTLTLDERGKVFIDGHETAVEKLGPVLAGLASRDSRLSVNLQSDRREPFGEVAKVMGIVGRAGIVHVAIATADNADLRGKAP
ncbi:biopolymer transporter ExbD [Trinickia violacea]|uniref:Biopolymer transporter ExbD n=1 Tax=Trinickia violacea TaxID=2571746 RepID=A0A4V1EHD3_9BURK|nr:biopolymer transporter ExbD [Trinickia violacea]QCP49870.1 biopolymer transporter ExbD [Trinickia violacea]